MPASDEVRRAVRRRPYYAVRARETGDVRSLRVVQPSSEELFNTARMHGFHRIRMQVLAAGGAGDTRAAYDIRPFSTKFSVVESARAFGAWCRANPDWPLELSIYVSDESIWRELAWRRLDIDESLSSSDLRFWSKVVYEAGKVQRQLCQEPGSETFGEFASWMGLDPKRWWVEATPHMGTPEEAIPVPLSSIIPQPLASRVVPGGTLRFTIG